MPDTVNDVSFRLRSVVLDSPDPPALATFYAHLLGWSLLESDDDWASIVGPDGGTRIAFQLEPSYVPPVWPGQPGQPLMMSHLDIVVDDLEAASEHAVQVGARLADFQPEPDVLVHLDPDGHPFCLFIND